MMGSAVVWLYALAIFAFFAFVLAQFIPGVPHIIPAHSR